MVLELGTSHFAHIHYNHVATNMRPNILGIQFRRNHSSIEQEQRSLKREISSTAETDFISALSDTVDWRKPATFMPAYDAVILGGSGDFDFDGSRADDDEAKLTSGRLLEKLRPLLTYIFEHDVPTFGICYGHQMLGAFAGARVVCDATQKKTLSHQVKLLAVEESAAPVCTDLPNTFWAHYAHKDVLDRVPEGATLLMNGGTRCKVSALRYKNNIYSTQFHPELSYTDLVERMTSAPQYLPEGVSVREVFKDEADSSKMLHNFCRLTKRVAQERFT